MNWLGAAMRNINEGRPVRTAPGLLVNCPFVSAAHYQHWKGPCQLRKPQL